METVVSETVRNSS